jgi:hypothetical protein
MTKATATSANAPVRYSPARASSVAVEDVSLRNEATARPAAPSRQQRHHNQPHAVMQRPPLALRVGAAAAVRQIR